MQVNAMFSLGGTSTVVMYLFLAGCLFLNIDIFKNLPCIYSSCNNNNLI